MDSFHLSHFLCFSCLISFVSRVDFFRECHKRDVRKGKNSPEALNFFTFLEVVKWPLKQFINFDQNTKDRVGIKFLIKFQLSRIGSCPRSCSGRTFLHDYVVILLNLAGDESFGFSSLKNKICKLLENRESQPFLPTSKKSRWLSKNKFMKRCLRKGSNLSTSLGEIWQSMITQRFWRSARNVIGQYIYTYIFKQVQ